MERFFVRHYQYCLYGLILILMVLSFLIGQEEGKKRINDSVVLSCAPEVLESLSISTKKSITAVAPSTPEYSIPNSPTVLSEERNDVVVPTEGKFLGSKNGTKYYTPGCAGAKRIKPENYIWFSDEQDAQLQGYSPASC